MSIGENLQIIWNPQEIERKSMSIIDEYLQGKSFAPVEKDIIKRIIHTTGDPDILDSICIHKEASRAGIEALRGGCNVYTDVNMLLAGVNRKKLQGYGGDAYCKIADEDIAKAAQELGITRAAAAMRLWGSQLDGSVVAIGNAPTALFEVLDLIEKGIAKPALIVGTPVGFVGAMESKELMIEKNLVPYVTVRGTRGGSPSAVSVVNALLYYQGN
ncbi:precorrin-8X methylmutase [Desulfuribacillus alkaliarsenatis]|uniref:Precorrin isomerase n=1 Tax=Desulfuribacillus alkaliarsenatis TaxID=766136 RepID=A0A1E5G4H9_9FIRM|nr:precorrin-8X methylmutase [Desulfuribacillus alkaliarsenatis]OEF97991.1 precorrin isomerase [Desulfuribacillus alkaliarsenatis]